MYMDIYSFIFNAHTMQQLFFSASMQRTEYYSTFPKMKQTIYLIQYAKWKFTVSYSFQDEVHVVNVLV